MNDYITIPLSNNGKNKYAGIYEAKVSPEDDILLDYKWSVATTSSKPYAVRSKTPHKGLMHRVILARKLERPLRKGEVVDHINGNGLDNRRENLRLATHSQNGMNRGKQSNNTSGFKGVSLERKTGKWVAHISRNGEYIRLGTFADRIQAYEAYCKAADELHEDFANHG